MKARYEDYTVSDFVADDDFLQHRLFPTGDSTLRWQQWLKAHPSKKNEWEEAVKLLEAVQLGLSDYARTYLSEEAESSLFHRIRETNARYIHQKNTRTVIRPGRRVLYGVAASAAIFFLAGWFLLNKAVSPPSLYRQLTVHQTDQLLERINSGNDKDIFFLPDSTTVSLSPNSRLSFAKEYGEKERKVYLSGQAEFDVVGNPEIPFLVYANEIVTKVLGTRFTVTAFDDASDITVKVTNGNVSVYRNENLARKAGLQQELLLLPNQQAVFVKSESFFNKTLVEKPEVVIPSESVRKPDFTYNESPVVNVFKDLQKAYGIEIVYDEMILSGCQLTASLAEESFEEKLDIVCKSIGAKHEVVDARVVVTARECK